MHVEPNTYIRLIKQCRLVNNYEHTIYFSSLAEQEAYFKSLPGVPFTKQSYQRYSSGVLTVKAPMSAIYECNYMMFKNESFEDKWFYAFVNKVEYVNNVTCRVYYEIDIMQTWHFNYYMCECFVEREHSATDNIGDNLVHEDIYFGPYVYSDYAPTPADDNGYTMHDLAVVIMYNPALLDLNEFVTPDNALFTKQFYGGVYQGVNFLAVPAIRENSELIDSLIAGIDFGSFGGFLSAFLMPIMFLPTFNDGFNEYNPLVPFSVTRNTSFNGYTPKNNKLFTYPYTCANLTSNRNEGLDFAFEYFYNSRNGVAEFIATGNMCANPCSIAFPYGYKGHLYATECSVSIPSYPLCTWGSDGVTEWINNNMFKSIATAGVGAAIASVSPLNAVSTATGLSNIVANPSVPKADQYRDYYNASVGVAQTPAGTLQAIGMARSEFDPGSVHGSVDGDVLIGTPGGREINARVKLITKQYAKIVDDFFSKFGYATNTIKIPNRNVRPYWTYVKTTGCLIKQAETRGMPSDDMAAICGVYDRGITFWTPEATIGDYSNQDNSPV